MENFKCLQHSVSIIGYKKNGSNFGACIAWGCQVDYDKMVFLMGSQSITGNNISKGDIIGISVLASDQMDIAESFGSTHSDKVNKFKDFNYYEDGSALIIKDAYSENVCEVIDVKHFEEIEEDNLIYVRVIKCKHNKKECLRY